MMFDHKSLLLRCLIVTLCLTGLCSLDRTSKGQNTRVRAIDQMIYDHSLRVKAENITLASIKELRFYGNQLHSSQGEPIKVTNTRTISTFLQALRHAYGAQQVMGNRTNTLEIRFQRAHGHTREYMLLYFNTYNPADCFGPEFYAAIHKLIPNAPTMLKPAARKVTISSPHKTTTTKKAATPAKKVTRRNAPPPNPLLEQKQRRGSDDKQP